MGTLHQLRGELLNDGRITPAEVEVIRAYVEQDGKLDHQDVRFLVELLSDARDVCEEFDALFFPALKQVLLADGQITPDEQYWLLKMLYGDGRVRPSERRFLEELREQLEHRSPEFEAIYAGALTSPDVNWDVGGRA